jgi:hypothetical protein
MMLALTNASAWITTIAVGWLMVRFGTAKKMLRIRRPERCAACGRRLGLGARDRAVGDGRRDADR